MKDSGEKLGILLASDEVERLNNIVKRGTARQALMAKAILQWERGYTIANSAKEIGRARATISIWRKNFTIYGFQVFHDGTTRTDLQQLAASLRSNNEPVTAEHVQQLALAHLAQIMPDNKQDTTATRSKVVNDLLGILLKCSNSKPKATGKLEEAIALAMGDN